MTKTTPTEPPLPPLRERLKLPDNFVDITDLRTGEVFVLTNPGSVDGSARGAWIMKDELGEVLPPAFFPTKEAQVELVSPLPPPRTA